MSFIRNVNVHDSDGNTIGSLNSALNTHDADVHNVIVNRFAHLHTGTSTTLSVATTGDGTEYTITVASATGFNAGDYIHLDGELTHPKIISIAGNVFTLDRRIDNAHSIGESVIQSVLDMSTTAGTMASPVIYYAAPSTGEVWHLTRMLFSMTHAGAGDLGLFGGLTALTNGVLVRIKVNGAYTTFTNWKTNADIKSDMYDVEFDARSGGGGVYGTSGRGTFKNAGAVVRLDGDLGDQIEIVVQDDITTLNSFTLKYQGHTEV